MVGVDCIPCLEIERSPNDHYHLIYGLTGTSVFIAACNLLSFSFKHATPSCKCHDLFPWPSINHSLDLLTLGFCGFHRLKTQSQIFFNPVLTWHTIRGVDVLIVARRFARQEEHLGYTMDLWIAVSPHTVERWQWSKVGSMNVKWTGSLSVWSLGQGSGKAWDCQ